MKPNDDLLTPQELAAYLQVDLGTIYNWTCQRRLPYIKVGRLLRFDRKRITEWLLQQEIEESRVQDRTFTNWRGKA